MLWASKPALPLVKAEHPRLKVLRELRQHCPHAGPSIEVPCQFLTFAIDQQCWVCCACQVGGCRVCFRCSPPHFPAVCGSATTTHSFNCSSTSLLRCRQNAHTQPGGLPLRARSRCKDTHSELRMTFRLNFPATPRKNT